VFERTSGSTAANKLVPYTDELLAEFGAATGPWLYDLYTRLPALRGTQSYWSISPSTRGPERTCGGTPIGFEDDTEYFGAIARLALRRMLAVPTHVARLSDMAEWRTETARYLVAAEDLGLVSVWHPSFLTLLLATIEARLDELLERVARARAVQIRERLHTHTLTEALWPRLTLVSCWGDSAAAGALAAARLHVPHATWQPKGLLATEGVVSFPLHDDAGASRSVAAVAGHLLEFLDLEHPSRRPQLAHELRVGASYVPVISTGGGFYRYRLGDAVRCEGYHLQAPVLRFEGRVDQVSDVAGEKLNAHLVSRALEHAQLAASTPLVFALLSPAYGELPRYRLFAEGADAARLELVVERLELALGESDGYRYARALGQLAPIEAVVVQDGAARYQRALIAAGRRAGDIKPSHLDARLDWGAVFGVAKAAPLASPGAES
jgi:hypothetical protein